MDRFLTFLREKIWDNRVRRTISMILVLAVTFSTTYMMVLPAITLERSETESVAGMDLGDRSAESSGESTAPMEGGESAPAESGESTPTETGESAPAESDESAPMESGESAPAESDESAPTESGESTPAESSESVLSEEKENESLPDDGKSAPAEADRPEDGETGAPSEREGIISVVENSVNAALSADKESELPSDGNESAPAGGDLPQDGETVSFDAVTEGKSPEGEPQTMTVHVEAAIDAFPEGTTMTVIPVTDQRVLDAMGEAVEGEAETVHAVDITFRSADGEGVQPAEGCEVRVTLASDAVENLDEAAVVEYTASAREGGEQAEPAAVEVKTVKEPELPAGSETEIQGDQSVTFPLDSGSGQTFGLVETGEESPEMETPAMMESLPPAEVQEKEEVPSAPDQDGQVEEPENTENSSVTVIHIRKTEAAEPGQSSEEPVRRESPGGEAEIPPEEIVPEEPAALTKRPTEEVPLEEFLSSQAPMEDKEEPAEVPMEEEHTPIEELLDAAEELESLQLVNQLDAVTTEGVAVCAQFAAGALPENVRLEVAEVEADAYADAAIQAAGASGAQAEVMALDITFRSGEEEVQPGGYVKITIQAPFLKETEAPKVVHMDDESSGTLIKSRSTESDAITLRASSFSVYAIVYTVDFRFRDYAYSIEGGSSIKLSELLSVLDIPVDISDVADVTFTDETLIEVKYSPSILGTSFDWTLKSLAAFLTEEFLHIELKDGTGFDIRVTDAQSTGEAVPADPDTGTGDDSAGTEYTGAAAIGLENKEQEINGEEPGQAVNTPGDSMDGEGQIDPTATAQKKATVYLRKVNEKGEPLGGAVFQLVYRVNDDAEPANWALVSPQEIDGIGEVSTGDSTFPSAIKSSEEGNPIGNLPDGEYQLVEVAAPDGYVIEKAAWDFTISNGKITVGGYQTGMDTAVIVIPNTQGVELPATGGGGVTAFVLLGGTMTLGAGAILLLRRRDPA